MGGPNRPQTVGAGRGRQGQVGALLRHELQPELDESHDRSRRHGGAARALPRQAPLTAPRPDRMRFGSLRTRPSSTAVGWMDTQLALVTQKETLQKATRSPQFLVPEKNGFSDPANFVFCAAQPREGETRIRKCKLRATLSNKRRAVLPWCRHDAAAVWGAGVDVKRRIPCRLPASTISGGFQAPFLLP